MAYEAMINGGGDEEVRAVERVLREANLDCRCTPKLASQGEGIGAVLLQVPLDVFVAAFLQPVADGARERFLRFFRDLRSARGEDPSSHGQLYVRPGAVTLDEWEESGRKMVPPGFRRPGDEQAEIIIDSLRLDDDMIDALFTTDFDALDGFDFQWDFVQKEWRDPYAEQRQ